MNNLFPSGKRKDFQIGDTLYSNPDYTNTGFVTYRQTLNMHNPQFPCLKNQFSNIYLTGFL